MLAEKTLGTNRLSAVNRARGTGQKRLSIVHCRTPRSLSGAALFLALATGACAQLISVNSLLPEMVDLSRLTRRPRPGFTAAQASSYDRRSKDPQTDWFANADAGQFIRTEHPAGRTEYVMADLGGPGTVTRIWSANPAGTIRFYFDGEDAPRITARMDELLTGEVQPFSEPFAYKAAEGTNLYFPFPYARRLKITAEDSDGQSVKGLYYHVGFRTYEPSTKVKTFRKDDIDAKLMRQVGLVLSDPSKRSIPKTKTIKEKAVLAPLQPLVVELPDGPSAIYELRIRFAVMPGAPTNPNMPWNSPLQAHNALRRMVFMATFDEDQSIIAPLGDFFGAAPGLNNYKTFPMEMSADGTMVCRFVMPYKEYGSLSFVNEGKAPVSLEIEARVGAYKWSSDSYHFYAQWTADQGQSQPRRDMTFLDVKGEGNFVGSNLSVANPTPVWWGEGDEKVFVDGESFPSTFGTGTEDYYGYAWGSPLLFERPYHAQPRVDGPASYGYTSVNRWQIFDAIPYARSLKFNLELWHWADVWVTFARTSYWYAGPGGTQPVDLDRPKLLPAYIEPIKPVEGAIEGEKMKIAQATGGKADVQGGFGEISRGEQLWWRNMKQGDKLVLKVPVPADGVYEIVGNFCTNQDYGIHALSIDGKSVGEPIDFWGPELKWKKIGLGTFDLKAGEVEFEAVCKGSRQGALPGCMFGLDYLILRKKQPPDGSSQRWPAVEETGPRLLNTARATPRE